MSIKFFMSTTILDTSLSRQWIAPITRKTVRYYGALCGHTVTALMGHRAHSAAHKHTITLISPAWPSSSSSHKVTHDLTDVSFTLVPTMPIFSY